MRKEDLIDFDEVVSPCFVIDERLLEKNVKILAQVEQQAGAKVLCALKGFSAFDTFNIIKENISGGTASSLYEAKLIHEYMGVKAHACFPVYLPNEFDEVCSLSSHITFNSFTEFDRYYRRVEEKYPSIKCAIRINPEYSEITTDLYNPASPKSRLGVKLQDFPDELPKGITGLHFHTLCEQGADVLERTLQVVEEKFGHLLHKLSWLNLGGGHHITKSGYDRDLLVQLIRNLKQNYSLEELILEPGEAIGWETGYLVSSVLDVIESEPVSTAMLDVSFAAHMPDCLEMPYKPDVVGAIIENDFFPTYQLGGNTCLAGDQIGNYSFINKLSAGDKIVFHDMAHYTMVKTTFFNGVKHPSIAIYTKQGELNVVKTFDYTDYKNKLGTNS